MSILPSMYKNGSSQLTLTLALEVMKLKPMIQTFVMMICGTSNILHASQL